MDHWESAATKCISSPSKKYTSITVENEFRKKLEYTLRHIQREILGLLRELRIKHGSDKIGDAGKTKIMSISNELKIKPFLVSILPEINAETTYQDFDTRVRDVLHQFLSTIYTRKTTLRIWINQLVIESWLRGDDYHPIRQKLSGIIPNSDDIEILLDAHDLAANQNLNLAFVTGDREHIKSNEPLITSTTRIKEVKYLDEFN